MAAPEEPWTIGRLLTWTIEYLRQHDSENPRLDAEVLLAAARGCRRIDLYTQYGETADDATRTAFREMVRRRAAEKRDEFAALHVAPLPWQLAQQPLRNAYVVVFTVVEAR